MMDYINNANNTPVIHSKKFEKRKASMETPLVGSPATSQDRDSMLKGEVDIAAKYFEVSNLILKLFLENKFSVRP